MRQIITERTTLLFNNSEAEEIQKTVNELTKGDWRLVKNGEPLVAPYQNIIILETNIYDEVNDSDKFIPDPKKLNGTGYVPEKQKRQNGYIFQD